jgi:predicted Ser/Thr protein kinase
MRDIFAESNQGVFEFLEKFKQHLKRPGLP